MDRAADQRFEQAFADKETADAVRKDPLVISSRAKARPMVSLYNMLSRVHSRALALTAPFLVRPLSVPGLCSPPLRFPCVFCSPRPCESPSHQFSSTLVLVRNQWLRFGLPCQAHSARTHQARKVAEASHFSCVLAIETQHRNSSHNRDPASQQLLQQMHVS